MLKVTYVDVWYSSKRLSLSAQGAAAAAAAARAGAHAGAAEGGAGRSRRAEGAARLLAGAWEAHLTRPPHGLPGVGLQALNPHHIHKCVMPRAANGLLEVHLMRPPCGLPGLGLLEPGRARLHPAC